MGSQTKAIKRNRTLRLLNAQIDVIMRHEQTLKAMDAYLGAIESLLVNKGICTKDELETLIDAALSSTKETTNATQENTPGQDSNIEASLPKASSDSEASKLPG